MKPRKKQIIEDFKNHVSSGKVALYKKYRMPFVMGERQGIYMTDVDGKKRLLNCHCNGGVFNLGHRNPQIIETLIRATEKFDIGNHHFISSQRAKLAKKIASLMPGDLNYTVFGVGGGEAVDLAIKLARGYTGKQKIVSLKGGYHGHTGLALATGDEQYRAPFGKNSPDFVQIPFGNLEAAYKEITEDTAAFIMETIPATLGIAIPDKKYMQALRKRCSQTHTLMIIDEVQTGLGRTGKLWAFEHYDILPDIVVLGKGLSGGIYPITATVFREPLESFFNQHPFIHVSTFGGSEIGAEVAMKVLEISAAPSFLEHVNKIADYLHTGFEKLKKKHPKTIKNFRQLGLMAGIEFYKEKHGLLFTKAAYESGMFSLYSNNDMHVCQLLPPLIITKEQADEILAKIDKAVSKLKFYSVAFGIKEFIDHLF
ncbi:aminotransferase class III-fold pyridoxal phosphate-dependent enzyme [Candidatus Sulfidibacterium hydrothermale]|uniref:class-III pyridoxal-phosphate-dependent aminotransferase n=1 Tax=Candidatus Sulfidibacterium hydrothermale TaxID=2875962 RepID=UPI001F0B5E1A|nr:aminotransferase class III-fold pyridoxal phosphate-dependent enzyme [Candidatus Sulfidibacterium hydrothermale]UBM63152.1 aminotransferase class III-fold pyridoxal phosphate-dependent enzyme [Candidatus Sulfidibacterium hydrothermale]